MISAGVIPSPSNTTDAGRKILAKDPDNSGSLGIAISEAVEMAAKDTETRYTLGSVLNHVILHQNVGGLRYHGAGTLVSQLMKDGYIEAMDIKQLETFEAGMLFANTEGIIPRSRIYPRYRRRYS